MTSSWPARVICKVLRPIARLRRRLALSPEQAEQLARIKFPCC